MQRRLAPAIAARMRRVPGATRAPGPTHENVDDESGRWPLVHHCTGSDTGKLMACGAFPPRPPRMLAPIRRNCSGATAASWCRRMASAPAGGHDFLEFLPHPLVVLKDDSNERVEKFVATRDRGKGLKESGSTHEFCYLHVRTKRCSQPV